MYSSDSSFYCCVRILAEKGAAGDEMPYDGVLKVWLMEMEI